MLGTQKGNEFQFQLLISCKENKFFVLLEFLVDCIAQLQCLSSDYLNTILKELFCIYLFYGTKITFLRINRFL